MPPTIFVSYSHKDEAWKDRVVEHLRVLGGVEVWDDRRLETANWRTEIEAALDRCDVAVVLISAASLTSRFVSDVEVATLLRAHKRLLPLVVRSCGWQQVGWLRGTRMRPDDGKPLAAMAEADQDAALAALTSEVRPLLPWVAAGGVDLPRRIDVDRLPQGTDVFVGRDVELDKLDAAWGEDCDVVQVVAPGGIGKTALVQRWLDRMQDANWRGARVVHAWTFYSQGSGADRQASEDGFFADAMTRFGIDIPVNAPVSEKGRALARTLREERTLLILDGVEPLQYPPGPMGGQLKGPGLKAMLQTLARASHAGLVVVTTREALADLRGKARTIDLDALTEAEGARLLHHLGVTRAGARRIKADDRELLARSRELDGHAYSLGVLGRWIKKAFGGDVRAHPTLVKAVARFGGHGMRVVSAYDIWLGAESAERQALRLLGLFDRPANDGCLAALRAKPVIPGLTDRLVDLDDADWRATWGNLRELRLVEGEGAIDAHPLLREFYAEQLKEAEAGRAGHLRLYEHLTTTTEDQPDTLEGLEPLYQAVVHGVRAGKVQEALDEVYYTRITGGGLSHPATRLGAVGANLNAVAAFFSEPWNQPLAGLDSGAKGFILSEAGFSLRPLGRLGEALDAYLASLRGAEAAKDWTNAAIVADNLSDIMLHMGDIASGVAIGSQGVRFADRAGGLSERVDNRSTLAWAICADGRIGEALSVFAEAEEIQAECEPGHPLLYSLRGFQYCDALFAATERVAWCEHRVDRRVDPAVRERVATLHRWAERARISPIDRALGWLTLARSELYAHILANEALNCGVADAALQLLEASGQGHHLPPALLTHAWTHHVLGDPATAAADLDECEDLCERSGLRLHLADTHLYRARLFKDRAALEKARALIHACGYGRRLPELADADEAANTWP